MCEGLQNLTLTNFNTVSQHYLERREKTAKAAYRDRLRPGLDSNVVCSYGNSRELPRQNKLPVIMTCDFNVFLEQEQNGKKNNFLCNLVRFPSVDLVHADIIIS